MTMFSRLLGVVCVAWVVVLAVKVVILVTR